MIDHDLDDQVALAVALAEFEQRPIEYATGPMADRRVRTVLRPFGVNAPKDRICGSINRLVADGVLARQDTGQVLVASGSCCSRQYPFVRLTHADPASIR